MLNLSKNRVERVILQDRLYSLRALKTPNTGKTLARILAGLGVIGAIILFLPWQQNVRGTGKVTAFNPANRPQTIESVLAGQIQVWHVREGEFVHKGDTIITIREVKEKYFDPQLLQRLQEQLNAKVSSLASKENKVAALQRQIQALRATLTNKLSQSKAKLEAEKVRFQNAESQYQRNKKLFEAGNIALTKFQEIEYKYQGAQADYLNAQIELNRVDAEYQDKISKAESDLSATRADQFDTEGAIAKLKNEYTNMQIRNERYQILAPQSGYIVKAMQAGIGETIKEGDPICTIMPDTADLAVELYVKAMDVPLVEKGRNVRIQFDGWPALQFSGWPSVSVGTFGGTVKVIDYVSSKPGEFRLIVLPDEKDEQWPKQLRVGSGIKAWVMLNDVPIWYELWRQLNGFPPSLYEEPLEEVIDKKGKSTKKPAQDEE